jgi:hypothetical protein
MNRGRVKCVKGYQNITEPKACLSVQRTSAQRLEAFSDATTCAMSCVGTPHDPQTV